MSTDCSWHRHTHELFWVKAIISLAHVQWTAILTQKLTNIWVGNLTIIGSDNGLAPGRHQAII